jgi:hypothetical protein
VQFVLGGVEHRFQVPEVGADGGDFGGQDDLVLVGDGLGVVALDPSAQPLDDLGVRVGEIDPARRDRRRRVGLDRAGRQASRSVRGDAAGLPRLVGLVGADLGPQLLVQAALGLLDALRALPRHRLRIRRPLGLQPLLGFAQPAAPPRGRRELRRQLVAAAITVELVLGRVGRDRLVNDLARELLVLEVLVAARVGLHLPAVDREHPDLRQPAPGAQRQHLAEQARQRLLVAPDEPGDGRVIGPLLRRDHPKRDVLRARPLDHPRRPGPARVGVQQQPHHHRRVISRPRPPVDPVGRVERVQVHLADGVNDKPRQVILRQPLPHIGRHQKPLLAVTRDKALSHAPDRLKPPGRHPTYATASRAAGGRP